MMITSFPTVALGENVDRFIKCLTNSHYTILVNMAGYRGLRMYLSGWADYPDEIVHEGGGKQRDMSGSPAEEAE